MLSWGRCNQYYKENENKILNCQNLTLHSITGITILLESFAIKAFDSRLQIFDTQSNSMDESNEPLLGVGDDPVDLAELAMAGPDPEPQPQPDQELSLPVGETETTDFVTETVTETQMSAIEIEILQQSSRKSVPDEAEVLQQSSRKDILDETEILQQSSRKSIPEVQPSRKSIQEYDLEQNSSTEEEHAEFQEEEGEDSGEFEVEEDEEGEFENETLMTTGSVAAMAMEEHEPTEEELYDLDMLEARRAADIRAELARKLQDEKYISPAVRAALKALPIKKERPIIDPIVKKRVCRAKKVKCGVPVEEEEYEVEPDPLKIWTRDGKPIPCVKGLESKDEECNAYCRWLRRQLILEGSGDKLDSLMTLKELGIKYRELLGGIRCVFICLSGTLLDKNIPSENAVIGFQMLRDFGLKIRFVTNTTQYSRRGLLEHLRNLGFLVEPEELYTAVSAARKVIEENKLRPYFLVEEPAMEDFEGINTKNPNSLVIGLSPTNFDYLRFNKALRLLMSGAPIVGIHKNRVHKKENGHMTLGPGPFIDVLQYTSSAQTYVVGKPTETFFRAALLSTGCCTANDTIIIGDDIWADIEGALKCDMRAALVQTGKYKEKDEEKMGDFSPTIVCKNFYIAVRCIVGVVAAELGLKTGESDTEEVDPRKFNREVMTRAAFRRKINAYVNTCGQPVWCLKTGRESEEPPMLKPSEYFTDDTLGTLL